MRGDITDIVTHAKFYDSRLRDFGVADTPDFAILYRLSCSARAYNSVSTTVLYSDVLRMVCCYVGYY